MRAIFYTMFMRMLGGQKYLFKVRIVNVYLNIHAERLVSPKFESLW